MMHLRNYTGFEHIFGSKIQDFFAYLEVNLFLIWESEDETWNLLYRNTGPDLIANQRQEGSVKIKLKKLCEHPESRIALNAGNFQESR